MKALFPGRRAFTLVELLVVMAVVLLLLAMIVPAAGPMLRGSHMTQAATMLVDQLGLARQQAMALNCPVEVRLYQYADPALPGQTAKYRALQIFSISPSGTAVALSKVQIFPGTVIMDSGVNVSSLSTLISAGTVKTGDVLGVSLPRVQKNYSCVAFRYMPDGSTNLSSATTLWFLTIHGLEAGDNLGAPPPNYFTVQINNSNGHLRSFRP